MLFCFLRLAERECAADQAPCAGTIAVSRAAALCIAGEEADLTTLEGPYVELGYHAGSRRPVWNVFTITETSDDGGRGGDIYTIDAANGELLGTVAWDQTP